MTDRQTSKKSEERSKITSRFSTFLVKFSPNKVSLMFSCSSINSKLTYFWSFPYVRIPAGAPTNSATTSHLSMNDFISPIRCTDIFAHTFAVTQNDSYECIRRKMSFFINQNCVSTKYK